MGVLLECGQGDVELEEDIIIYSFKTSCSVGIDLEIDRLLYLRMLLLPVGREPSHNDRLTISQSLLRVIVAYLHCTPSYYLLQIIP